VAVFVLLICSMLIIGLAEVAVNVFVSDVSGELNALELLTTTLAVAETAASPETVRTFDVDPEIVRSIGTVTVVALAVISKDPKILFSHEDPVGTHNDTVIKKSIKFWSQNFKCNLWLGWGNNGTFLERNKYAYKLIRKHFNSKKSDFKSSLGPLLIRKTKLNQPMHPLYCRNNSNLIEDISFI